MEVSTMALKFSKEQKERLKRVVAFNTDHPEVFWWGMEYYHKENRLTALMENDPDYKKECREEMKKLREKYAQKYMDEGLL